MSGAAQARRRYAANGSQGVPVACAAMTLEVMVQGSPDRLITRGFGHELRRLAIELSGSPFRFWRRAKLHLSRDEAKRIIRRHPDAFEIDRDCQTIRLFEAEDTSLLTEEKLRDYADLSIAAWESFGWRVELVIIDRYGSITTHDPDDLFERAVVIPTSIRSASDPEA